MKIYGIGIDIVEVSRIKKIVKNHKNFLTKFFSQQEIDYCLKYKNKYERIAARFSAKEAAIKSISDKTISFKRIEILNELSGKPLLSIKGLKKFSFLLSISHTKKYACAVCISFKK